MGSLVLCSAKMDSKSTNVTLFFLMKWSPEINQKTIKLFFPGASVRDLTRLVLNPAYQSSRISTNLIVGKNEVGTRFRSIQFWAFSCCKSEFAIGTLPFHKLFAMENATSVFTYGPVSDISSRRACLRIALCSPKTE